MIKTCPRVAAACFLFTFMAIVFGVQFIPELYGAPLQTNAIPDVEQFALAKDRKAFLDRLVPGSEEDFYFRCLHAQNTGDSEFVTRTLPDWRSKWGETPRWISIRNRQAVLNYEFQPDASAQVFQDVLGLHFGHQRIIPPAEQALPSLLNPQLFDRDSLVRHALEQNRLDILTEESLYDQYTFFLNSQNQDRYRYLLQRIRTPDYPELVKLVVAELKSSHSGGFGSLPIHSALTLEQLHACRDLHADLAGNVNWVHQVVKRIHGKQVPLPELFETRLAEFAEIWKFIQPLPVSQNSLKSAVLHELLSLQLKSGKLDRDLFIEYLKLPRRLDWVHPTWREKFAATPAGLVDDNADFKEVLRGCLPPQPDQLVEMGLQYFLRDAANLSFLETLIEENYLKRQLATAQVLAGLGDNARWSAILTPAGYRDLVERIDLAFQTEDRTWYSPDESVSLNLKVKNVKELVVRVFKLNTLNCYRKLGNSLNADIPLEGLIPNHERKIPRSQSPGLQTIESIELPELKGRGMFVVDIIGGGKNCRALIHKGRLVHVARTTRMGQEVTILDENGETCASSAIWVGERRFESDEKGRILVPFSDAGSVRNVVLEHDGFAYPASLTPVSEDWSLELAAHCDRESLLPGATARFLLRPMLRVAGEAIPVDGLLENISVQLLAKNQDDEPAVKTFRDVKLSQAGELALEFIVPPRLKNLSFTLSGEIRVISQNKTNTLSTSTSLSVNGIADTDQIVCPQLLRNGDQYLVDVLGRNGEPLAKHPVTIEVLTRWTTESVRVEMQSDEKGRITLGELLGVTELKVQAGSQNPQQWDLSLQAHQSAPSSITILAKTPRRIPIPPRFFRPSVEQKVCVYEKRDGRYVREIPNAAILKAGSVELKALEEGEFELIVQGQPFTMQVRCVAGRPVAGHLVNPLGAAELSQTSRLNISEMKREKDQLQIKIDGASDLARVHVFATRYVPRFSAGVGLDNLNPRQPAMHPFNWNGNRYVSARQLGDEYLYILNRQGTPRRPGSMLTRPSLLMTPWSLGPTDTQDEVLQRDEALSRGTGMDALAVNAPAALDGKPGQSTQNSDFASLDFLAEGTLVFDDLEIGRDGTLNIPLRGLGDKHHVTVVAVDLFSTSQRTIAFEPKPLKARDQRIDHALPKDGHFAMQKRTSILAGGETFVLENLLTGKYETVSDLRQVWRFLLANSSDPGLAQFEFLTRWSELKNEERRKLYDQHACHEFNYWLYRKDQKFFKDVVLPVLQNRHEPTFMDCWLLERDLSEWNRPWRFGQLNTFEQVLLAQRLPAARAGILRRLTEQFETLPPDDVLRETLFSSQMASGKFDKNEVDSLRSMITATLGEVSAMPAPASGDPGSTGGGLGGLAENETGKRLGSAQRFSDRGRGDFVDSLTTKDEKAKSWDKAGLIPLSDSSDVESSIPRDYLDRGRNAEVQLGRNGFPSFYQAIKPTERWVESAWYRILQTSSTHDRIPLNRFWLEFAQTEADKKFVSASFGLCRANLSDSILAMAVLDLPETSNEGKTEVDGKSIKWTPENTSIVFHQQVASQEMNAGQVMVSENFFDPTDRHQMVNSRQADKFLAGPFYRGKLYGGQVVVTNPTNTPQSIQVLVQVPAGSIAVNRSHPTRSTTVELGSFASSSVEYWFYFPEAGELDHFPAHASDTTGILAHATPSTLNVLAERAEANQESWEYVSQNGTVEQMLAWLDKANLTKTDLELIAFRMKEKEVFALVLDRLTKNQTYHRTLWSYSVNHRDNARLGEFLEHETGFVDTCRPALESKLLTLRPQTRRWYEHVEFWPLINSRAHQVGSQRRVLNNQLFQQYVELLNILSCHQQLDANDRMAVVCYLLLQDRFEEAIEWFGTVERDQVAGKLQYDYAAAYLAMLQAKPDKAEEIAKQYANASPNRWRERFAQISAQVAELKGEKTNLVDPDDVSQSQAAMAATMESLEAKLEGQKLHISCRNAKELTISYYPIDVELMFSRDPFSNQLQTSEPITTPTLSETVKVGEKENQLVRDIPESLGSQNLLIEIRNGEEVRVVRRLANRLDLQVATSMGQLQVRKIGTDQPLVATYVKVYVRRSDGQVVFWKDGYTDLRGKFDYVTQNVQPLDNIVEFAIILINDQEGCTTRTVKPPTR
jgi:hypothetical protein